MTIDRIGSVNSRSSPADQARHHVTSLSLGGNALFPPGVSDWAAQEELLKVGDGLSEQLAAVGQGNGLLHDGAGAEYGLRRRRRRMWLRSRTT